MKKLWLYLGVLVVLVSSVMTFSDASAFDFRKWFSKKDALTGNAENFRVEVNAILESKKSNTLGVQDYCAFVARNFVLAAKAEQQFQKTAKSKAHTYDKEFNDGWVSLMKCADNNDVVPANQFLNSLSVLNTTAEDLKNLAKLAVMADMANMWELNMPDYNTLLSLRVSRPIDIRFVLGSEKRQFGAATRGQDLQTLNASQPDNAGSPSGGSGSEMIAGQNQGGGGGAFSTVACLFSLGQSRNAQVTGGKKGGGVTDPLFKDLGSPVPSGKKGSPDDKPNLSQYTWGGSGAVQEVDCSMIDPAKVKGGAIGEWVDQWCNPSNNCTEGSVSTDDFQVDAFIRVRDINMETGAYVATMYEIHSVEGEVLTFDVRVVWKNPDGKIYAKVKNENVSATKMELLDAINSKEVPTNTLREIFVEASEKGNSTKFNPEESFMSGLCSEAIASCFSGGDDGGGSDCGKNKNDVASGNKPDDGGVADPSCRPAGGPWTSLALYPEFIKDPNPNDMIQLLSTKEQFGGDSSKFRALKTKIFGETPAGLPQSK